MLRALNSSAVSLCLVTSSLVFTSLASSSSLVFTSPAFSSSLASTSPALTSSAVLVAYNSLTLVSYNNSDLVIDTDTTKGVSIIRVCSFFSLHYLIC
jgi:hypothetical protein